MPIPDPLTSSDNQTNTQQFNLKNIRTLLIEGFTDGELRQLCYYEPEFKPVYDQLAEGMGKDRIVDRLIEYAEHRELIERLLTLIKERNPKKYEKHRPYTRTKKAKFTLEHVYSNRIQRFVDEYIGTSDYPAPFGGRDTELSELNEWLTEEVAPQFAIIVAEAGRGVLVQRKLE